MIPTTPKRSCSPPGNSSGGTGTLGGSCAAVIGGSLSAWMSAARKAPLPARTAVTVSVVVPVRAAGAPPVCVQRMLCRAELSLMVIVAFAVTVAPNAGVPETATVTSTGLAATAAVAANPSSPHTIAVTSSPVLRWCTVSLMLVDPLLVSHRTQLGGATTARRNSGDDFREKVTKLSSPYVELTSERHKHK